MTTPLPNRHAQPLKLRISPKTSDRACFFGKTGTGKTTLIRRILSTANRWVILDPKHEFPADAPIVSHFNKKLPRQIIRVAPSKTELSEWYDAIDEVWDDGNRILVIDEGTLINPSTTRISPSLGKAIRTGRSRNLGVWFASQRPKDIPSAVFTEAEHFFLFRLTWKKDREKVLTFTSDILGQAHESLRGHDFLYYNVSDDSAYLMRSRK